MASPLQRLAACGQSVWIDFLSRALLRSGSLARAIESDGVVAVTSNPTIFAQALTGGRSLEPVLALSDPIGVSAQPSGDGWRGGPGGGQLLQPKPFVSIWRHINSWSVSAPPRICLSLIASIRLAVPAASKSGSYAGIPMVLVWIGRKRLLLEVAADRRSRAGRRRLPKRSARVVCGGSRSPHERQRGGARGSGEGA